jgi:hypothetical protein
MKLRSPSLAVIFTAILVVIPLVLPTQAAAQAQQFTVSDSWQVGHGDYIQCEGVPSCGNNTDINPLAQAANIIAAYRTAGRPTARS